MRKVSAAKNLKNVSCSCDFAYTFRQGLAFFSRQQIAQFRTAGQQCSANGLQQIVSLLNAAITPGAQCISGGVNCAFGLLDVRLRKLTDDIGRIRRIDIVAVTAAGSPASID